MTKSQTGQGLLGSDRSHPVLRGQSSQAILQEQSSQALDYADMYTPVEERHAFPIRLHVHGLRVFLATILATLTLAALSYLMIDGFTFTTLDATRLSDKNKTDLLDTYNTYSGSVAAVVGMIFQQFVALLLPVFFLCFLTKATLSDKKSVLQLWGPMIVVSGASWVLCVGLNAINVQFDSPRFEFAIAFSDLVTSQDTIGFGNAMTNVINSAHSAGIPSTDTILRSAIRPMTANLTTACGVEGGVLANNPADPSVLFGFPSNSWFEYMLPQSLAADASFSFKMTGAVEADATLPFGDLDKAAALFAYGFWSLSVGFAQAWYGTKVVTEDVYAAVKAASDEAELVANMQNTLLAFNANNSFWVNFSIAEASVEFSSVRLSAEITFEAVTFELPVKNATMRDWFGKDPDADDWVVELGMNTYCNDHACVLPTPVVDGLKQDQVRILRLCMTEADGSQENVAAVAFPATAEYEGTCKFPSNSSALILSIGRHVSVDQVDILDWSGFSITNPRTTFRVTVGRLSWQTTDLAEVYGAQCSAGADCDGLYFPLSNNQHVLVGKANLQRPQAVIFPYYLDGWQVLARANTKIDSATQGDIFYPPTYPLAASSRSWSDLSGYDCTYTGSDYINNIIQRHIYSKDPLQPAYTAGLFWLFQNAAVRDVEPSSSSTGIQLRFDGNRQWMSPRVSMPRTSACITVAGCVATLIVGLLVTCRVQSAQYQAKLNGQLAAHNMAALLADSNQFPSLLVHAGVREAASGDGKSSAARIQEFEIDQVRLRHRVDTSTRNITLQPRPAIP